MKQAHTPPRSHWRFAKRSPAWLAVFLIAALLIPQLALAAPATQDVVCASEYTTQADDWLSKLAEKYLGDAMAYPAIVEATNLKHAADAGYAEIVDPDRIEIGWNLCIPGQDEASTLLTDEQATTASAIRVDDALGNTTEFSEPPQNVVSVGRGIFMMADALYLFPEAQDRVVGLEGRNQSVSDFLPLVDPTFDQVTVLEMDAGPEQVAQLQPDVVVLKSYMAEERGVPFEQVGIPVVYLDLETVDQYLRDIETMGQLFGNEARAEEIQDFYQMRLDRVVQAVDAVADDEKPDVLLLQYSDKGGEVAFKAPPASWIQTTMVEMAGGNPIWTEAAVGGSWAVVNLEQIAAWNPDVIFIISYKSDPSEIVDNLKSDAKWQALKAVQDDQIYGFAKDFYSWDQPDTRWILGLTWLAGKLHPERFADNNMMKDAYTFFDQMYGLDRASVDANIVPTMQGDIE